MDIKSKLEIKKTYSVDGKEYDNKKTASIAAAKLTLGKLVSEGVESIIENYVDFIKALRILSPELGDAKLPAPKQGAKGTLNSLDWTLSQKGMRIVRSKVSWPVYHIFLENGEERVITYKKEVWSLCNLYDKEGIEGLLKYENQ
jgi:hypothetical protein